MMKLLPVLTLLTILNGWSISSVVKINETVILDSQFHLSMHSQARNCPVYRRCKQAGGSE
ncbi:MAG: hypothetical protein WBA77_16860 [Microcoleaceae cyanobacterium]